MVHQCLACLAHFMWMVCEMRGKWPHSCCFVGCHFYYRFKTAHDIFVYFPSSFFSKHFVIVQVIHPYTSTDAAWKNSHFILSDFHTIINLSTVVHALPMHVLTLLSFDEILLPRYMNWSNNFRGLSFNQDMATF